MARKQRDRDASIGELSRRKLLAAAGSGGAFALAGCTSSGGSGTDTPAESGGTATDDEPAAEGMGGATSSAGGTSAGGDGATTGGEGSTQASSGPLQAGGSSTVYPITNDGASVWVSNPPAGDEDYWVPEQYGYDTDENLAEFFGSAYGFDSGGSGPPFAITVGLSHSGTGIEKIMNQQVDIADSSAGVEAELPDRDSYDSFTDHVVGVDGQPVVVSRPIYEAGVTKLTGEQLRGIYRGEITNWSEIDSYSGEDKEIQAICRAEGSGTDTSFRANLLGGPDASITCDSRIGQNQQVRTAVQNSDNAIAYMALAFVGGDTPAIALELEGTTYELGKNLGAEGYPLSRDLHCYTWEGTSEKEAAFIRYLLSAYGQRNFVAANDYFKLPPERREQQRSKLPEAQMDVSGTDPTPATTTSGGSTSTSGNTTSGGN